MLRKIFFLFSLVTLIGVLLQDAEACACIENHPQIHYCDSDFAIAAKIIKKKTSKNATIVYDIEILNKYKAKKSAEKAIKNKKIYIVSDVGISGLRLTINKSYVMTGTIFENKMFVNQCNFIREVDTLSRLIKNGFTSVYEKGCKCKIQYCYSKENCRKDALDDTCRIYKKNKSNCYFEHSACVPNTDEVCKWNNECQLVDCLIHRETNRKEVKLIGNKKNKIEKGCSCHQS